MRTTNSTTAFQILNGQRIQKTPNIILNIKSGREMSVMMRELPDRYANQLNGKSVEENYRRMKKKRSDDFMAKLLNDFETAMKHEVKKVIDEALDEVKKWFK